MVRQDINTIASVIQAVSSLLVAAFTFYFYRRLVTNDTERSESEKERAIADDADRLKQRAIDQFQVAGSDSNKLKGIIRTLVRDNPDFRDDVLKIYELHHEASNDKTVDVTTILNELHREEPGKWPNEQDWFKTQNSKSNSHGD